MPCTMCSRKGLQCEFSLKQKPGPKVGMRGGRLNRNQVSRLSNLDCHATVWRDVLSHTH